MFADRHLTADKSDTGSKDNSHRNQCPENNLHGSNTIIEPIKLNFAAI